MRKAVTVGFTGQTGAGKSTACEYLKNFGFAVIPADKIAKEIMEPGSPLLFEIGKAFGEDVIREDGSLNRSLLAERAFSSRENTDKLNGITHPVISDIMLYKAQENFINGYEAVILDASQLFESGLDKKCNLVFSVLAPYEDRLKRIKERDQLTDIQAEARMAAQYPEQFFIDNSDYVIDNDGTPEELSEQMHQVFQVIEKEISGE